MDIWQKINPFHPRPPSSQRPFTPFTITEDAHSSQHTSSIDVERQTQSRQMDYRDVHTPLPPSPTKTHKRNPSILRTLAHHPSLSALKSRSKAKRRSKNPPPMPDFGIAMGGEGERWDGRGMGMGMGEGGREERGKLRKGEGLKGSKSVPRGLRLSGEYSRVGDRQSTQAVHHLPLPSSEAESIPKPSLFSTTPVRRKPAPTPEITIEHQGFGFSTPESVRIRRLRFEIELRHGSLNGSGRSPRRRGVSCDESPGRSSNGGNGLLSTKHLSSPPPSSPARTPPPPLRTQQHPHPVPRMSETYGVDSSMSYYYTPGDFQPLTNSGRTINDGRLDDGLDLLVGDQELPSGTPAGKKDDLKKGKFVDGARHEKGAIRFFSRDTYTRLTSPSPTPSPVPSPTPVDFANPASSSTSTSRQEKRSSSPFEVKLSACVTKRMSLDAFGTPTPPKSEEGCISETAMEELLEEYDSDLSEDDEDQDEDDSGQVEREQISAFQHTSLSTILESTSTRGGVSGVNHLVPPPEYLTSTPAPGLMTPGGKTPYFTADSSLHTISSLGSNGLPIPSESSSFAPRAMLGRKHASAPPLAFTQKLLRANVEHTRALKDEIEKGEDVRKILQLELEEKEEVIRELQIRLVSKEADLQNGLQQLRTALNENEEFCESLQQAHDALAVRCADLESECAELVHLRSDDAQTVVEAQQALAVAEDRVKELVLKENKAAEVVSCLKKTLEEVEGQLEITGSEYVECIARHGVEFAGLMKTAGEAQERIEGLELANRHLHEEMEEKDGEMRRLLGRVDEQAKQLDVQDAKLGEDRNDSANKTEVIARLQMKIQEMELAQLVDQSQNTLDTAQAELLEKTITDLQAEVQAKEESRAAMSAENDKIRNETYSKIRQMEGSARDSAFKLSTLEISLSEAKAQLGERSQTIANLTSEAHSLQEAGEKSLATSAADLKNALRQLSAKESIINVLREKVRTVGFAGDEKFAMAQAESQGLRVEMEGLSRRCAEAELGLKEGGENLARLEEERRGWDEERSELIQMITKANNSQDSASILRDELDQTQQDLEAAQQSIENLSLELEDARNALVTRKSTLGLQDEELAYLRAAMTQAEDAIDAAHCETDRRTKDFQRAISRLEETISELQDVIASRDVALQNALMSSEMNKTSSEDGKSRLNTYLGEIDRLSLREAELGKLVDDLRRKSADDEMRRAELVKRIDGLEMDRELLNVALDSKQTELILLQRATPTPTPRSTVKSGMAKSTSHLSTPTPVSRDMTTTPVPTKRLGMSISSSDISNLRSSHSRRESMTLATPASLLTPKGKTAVLGASTRHNRRESSMGGAAGGVRVPVVQGGLGGRRSVAGQEKPLSLSRQSSLPVLKGRKSVVAGGGGVVSQGLENSNESEELV